MKDLQIQLSKKDELIDELQKSAIKEDTKDDNT